MSPELLMELLEKNECEYLDFKATMYRKETYGDLLKDVMSMANSDYQGSRYIVMGVKQDIQGTYSIIGIEENDKIDISTFQQLFFQNIEPMISTIMHYITFKGKNIAVLEIKEPKNPPYMLRKRYGNLHEGTCYIRREAGNGYALRSDFDRFLTKGQQFEVRILDSTLRAWDVENACALLECSFRNLTDLPITIIYGMLETFHDDLKVSQHRLFGFEREMVGADFKIPLLPKSEKIGEFLFSFSSNDCLKLQLDEYGYTDKSFYFKLTVEDSIGNNYSCTIDDGFVLARGEFLWKIQLAKQKGN